MENKREGCCLMSVEESLDLSSHCYSSLGIHLHSTFWLTSKLRATRSLSLSYPVFVSVNSFDYRMAAFGISFPKLTLSRSSISKADANVPAGKPKAAPTTATTRTLSLSIKNVPSQPLHYDVSTTTAKKKPTAIATILAIDGESKQLPKNLSVFNELQLDESKSDSLYWFSLFRRA